MIKLRRQLDSIEFAPNQTKSLPQKLPLDNYYIALFVELTVNHSNTGATPNQFDFYNLIDRIEIIANGSDTIKAIDGRALYLNNLLYGATKPYKKVDFTDGDKTSKITGFIFFAMPKVIRPFDTILPAFNLNSLDFKVKWNTEAEVGAGITVNDAIMRIATEEATNYVNEQAQGIYKENIYSKEVLQSTSNFRIQLDIEKQYRSLLVYAEDGRNGLNNVINHLQVKYGNTVLVDLEGDIIREENKLINGVEVIEDGVYLIEFCDRGKLIDRIDARGVATFDIIADVSKQGTDDKIYVFTNEAEF